MEQGRTSMNDHTSRTQRTVQREVAKVQVELDEAIRLLNAIRWVSFRQVQLDDYMPDWAKQCDTLLDKHL